MGFLPSSSSSRLTRLVTGDTSETEFLCAWSFVRPVKPESGDRSEIEFPSTCSSSRFSRLASRVMSVRRYVSGFEKYLPTSSHSSMVRPSSCVRSESVSLLSLMSSLFKPVSPDSGLMSSISLCQSSRVSRPVRPDSTVTSETEFQFRSSSVRAVRPDSGDRSEIEFSVRCRVVRLVRPDNTPMSDRKFSSMYSSVRPVSPVSCSRSSSARLLVQRCSISRVVSSDSGSMSDMKFPPK